jgi:hypothetical protein
VNLKLIEKELGHHRHLPKAQSVTRMLDKLKEFSRLLIVSEVGRKECIILRHKIQGIDSSILINRLNPSTNSKASLTPNKL